MRTRSHQVFPKTPRPEDYTQYMGCFRPRASRYSKVTATPKQTVISKQKIGWGLVALAFVLVLILVRYATLYWLEVLAVPIMGLVALGLTWALSE